MFAVLPHDKWLLSSEEDATSRDRHPIAICLLEKISAPLFLLSSDGLVIWANRSCRRLLTSIDSLEFRNNRLVRVGRQAGSFKNFLMPKSHNSALDVFVLGSRSGKGGVALIRLTPSGPDATDLSGDYSQTKRRKCSLGNQVFSLIELELDATTNTAPRGIRRLNSAEHALCASLAHQKSIKDWAQTRGISMRAATNQLEASCMKLGVANKESLVQVWLILKLLFPAAEKLPRRTLRR